MQMSLPGIILCLLLAVNSQSQAYATGYPGARNHIYLEGGSIVNFSSVSLNAERLLFSIGRGKLHLYGRAGYGIVNRTTILCDKKNSTGGMLAMTLLTGRNRNHFEFSGGAYMGVFKTVEYTGPLTCDDSRGFQTIPLVDIGYRYQKPEGGFLFRAKLGTLGAGIALGFAF